MPAASAADPLERLFSRLVENLTALDPGALHRPIRVADIHERLVPYRTHRAALGLDSSEDYEMTVLRLLAGEGGHAQLFPDDVREAVVREVAAANPDTGLFRQFPDATVVLDLAQAESEPEPPAEPAAAMPLVPAGDDDAGAGAASAEEEDLPFMLEEQVDEAEPPAARPREVGPGVAACAYCGGALPVGRTVLFCPFCGQNVGVVHCPTCDSELDVGWQFCISCGQKVTGLG